MTAKRQADREDEYGLDNIRNIHQELCMGLFSKSPEAIGRKIAIAYVKGRRSIVNRELYEAGQTGFGNQVRRAAFSVLQMTNPAWAFEFYSEYISGTEFDL